MSEHANTGDCAQDSSASQQQVCEDLGGSLQAARQASGMSVEDVAQEMRNTRSLVEAIEAGAWEKLGPAVYARGYLRSYGRLVDVDVVDMDRYFESAEESLPQKADVMPPEQPPHWHRVHTIAAYVIATGLIAAPAFLWISHLLEDGTPGAEQSVVESADADGSAQAGSSSADVSGNGPAMMASMTPRPDTSRNQASVDQLNAKEPDTGIQTRVPVESATVSEPASMEDSSQSAEPTLHELVLSMSEDAWLEVSSGNGERLAYGLMPADSEHRFPVADGLTVRIGNADAVTAQLDGEPLDLTEHTQRDLATFELP